GPCLQRFLPVVQNLFSCPFFIEYGIAGNRVINRITCTPCACRIAPSRFGLEHPRPYALGCHRLSGASAGKSSDNRQGESCAGETSLVCEPMADEATRSSLRRSWPSSVHADGKVGR